jgi:CheY-like chemotaxis protein
MAHKSSMEFAPVDVNQFLRSLANLLRETFPKTIAITIDTDPNAPPLLADANRLHQALLNLAVNGRDAMPGGGTLAFSTHLVPAAEVRKRFQTADATQYVSIAVTDTGSGIEPAVRDRIFDPFFTTKEQGKGTGLGLTVAYGIVGSHNGFIDMQTEPGSGTTFRIYLPVRPVAPGTAVASPAALTGNTAPAGGRTLLFVDDEIRQAELMKQLLEGKGYRVLLAHDGVEAVSLYRRHKDDIDVVVMDLGLPRLDGWQAFLRMKQEEPGVRAIFASGYIKGDIKADMIRHGAAGIIHKPYVPDDLLGQIAAAVGQGASVDGRH